MNIDYKPVMIVVLFIILLSGFIAKTSAQIVEREEVLHKATKESPTTNWKVFFTNKAKQTVEFEAFATNHVLKVNGQNTIVTRPLGKFKLAYNETDHEGGGIFTLGQEKPIIVYRSVNGAKVNGKPSKDTDTSPGKVTEQDADAKAAKMRALERERADEAISKKLKEERDKANANDPSYAKRKEEADAKLKEWSEKDNKPIVGIWSFNSGSDTWRSKAMVTIRVNKDGSVVWTNIADFKKGGSVKTVADGKAEALGSNRWQFNFGPQRIVEGDGDIYRKGWSQIYHLKNGQLYGEGSAKSMIFQQQ